VKGSVGGKVHACSAGSRNASCNERFGIGQRGNGLDGLDDNDESLDARRENAAGIFIFSLYGFFI